MGKIVNKTELAAILGKSTRSITLLQAEGMPFVQGGGNGKENAYDTAKVIEWLINKEARGGADKDAEQAKLIQQQIELARRKNQREAGEVIDLQACITVVQRAIFAIRQKIVTCELPRETKQAILVDLQSLRATDFGTIKDEDDGAAADEVAAS